MLPEFETKDFNEVQIGDLVQVIKKNNYNSIGDMYIVENIIPSNSSNRMRIKVKGSVEYWTEEYFSVLKIKPASEVIVGDFMFRVSAGSLAFPKNTLKKISEIQRDNYYYTAGFSVYSKEVLVLCTKKTQQTTQKEQPKMRKLQDILNQIFGATDYEKRPKYLVVVYSADGAEIAQTIANSIEEVESKFKTTPSLIGCTAVCYKATTEITTEIPVITTKLKDKYDNK